jgi:hypothetical protein
MFKSNQGSGKTIEIDNSPIAIATREFVGAVNGKAPQEVVGGCLSILSQFVAECSLI